MTKKQRELLSGPELDGTNMARRARNNLSRKLRINGSISKSPIDILSEQKRPYQQLYTSGNKSAEHLQILDTFLRDVNIPRITEEQKQSCEGEITVEECATLQTNFQGNNAPGNDGIPIEFYRRLWSLIFVPSIK